MAGKMYSMIDVDSLILAVPLGSIHGLRFNHTAISTQGIG
jgi:hypothetical protein